jgi:hypothetical protein
VCKVASLVSTLEALDHTIANLGASLASSAHRLNNLDTVSRKVILSRFKRMDKFAELSV